MPKPGLLKRWGLAVLIVLGIAGCGRLVKENRACFQDTCYRLEVVTTEEDRQKGLQHRTSLPRDNGMLFVFPSSDRHRFWMKDTFIPLDMIWIDYANRVVHVEPQVPPCQADPCPSYGPPASALYVLELNAGQARKAGIAAGSRVDFQFTENFDKKSMQ